MDNREKHIEDLSFTLNFLNSIDDHFEEIHNELNGVNNKMCDLEHDIENSNFNAFQGYEKAKALKELRQDRRRLKNEVELLDKLHEWHKRNKNMEIDLFKILSAMRNLKELQDNWIYKKRDKEANDANTRS